MAKIKTNVTWNRIINGHLAFLHATLDQHLAELRIKGLVVESRTTYCYRTIISLEMTFGKSNGFQTINSNHE